MNKQELINAVAEFTGYAKKDVTPIVEAVFDTIAGELADGNAVKLQGFGNFEVRERSARKGRNPQTSEEIYIPASRVPAWKAAKAVKDAIK